MPAKFTRPDQYYGKPGKAPRDLSDIRARILPAFAVLLLLELAMAFSLFRFWQQQNHTLEDQRTLFRAKEILAESRQDSLQLARLVDQAIASPNLENIKAYALLVQKKSAPVQDAPLSPDTILNSLSDVTPSNLKLRNASIFFNESERSRFDQLANEASKLRDIDEQALASLQGEDQTSEPQSGRADPEFVQVLLSEDSYQARRTRLSEDFSSMQAALDLRILTLINKDAAISREFFSTGLAALVLLLPATAFLGWFLHRHEARRHVFHKNQVRRLNDDLSKVRGELSQIQSDQTRPGLDSDEQ